MSRGWVICVLLRQLVSENIPLNSVFPSVLTGGIFAVVFGFTGIEEVVMVGRSLG